MGSLSCPQPRIAHGLTLGVREPRTSLPISASRLVAALAARLDPVVPRPFRVRARGADVLVEHPESWGYMMSYGWIEDEGEGRSDVELAELVAWGVLNSIQDTVSEALTEPRPPLSPGGGRREMAPCRARCDGTTLRVWYGVPEAAPMIGFAPIPMADLARAA
jgi:hypothetical protein